MQAEKQKEEEQKKEKLDAKRKLSQMLTDAEKIARRLSFAGMHVEASLVKSASKQIKKAERSL